MGSKRKRTTETTNQVQQRRHDPYITAASQQAVGMAQDIATREYTPYTEQRVASLTENERMGSEAARSGYSEAQDLVRRSAMGFDEAFDTGALDPYLRNLADPMIREQNREFERRRNDMEAQAQRVGAFGGDRMALERAALDQSQMERVGDIRGQAFDRAIGVFQNDQQRRMQAGAQLSQMNSQQVRELMATGGVERLLEQAQLDFDYGQFLEARDWSVQNLGPLLQTLQAVPKDITETTDRTSTTETKESGGTLGAIMGAATTLAGAYFTGGGSLTSMIGGAKDLVGGMFGRGGDQGGGGSAPIQPISV